MLNSRFMAENLRKNPGAIIIEGHVQGLSNTRTLGQIGILEELVRRGNKVVNPFTQEISENMKADPARRRRFIETCRQTFSTDVFVTSSNALTKDGKIVSIDYAGNRVAGIIYGAPRIILPVGRNKIAKDSIETRMFNHGAQFRRNLAAAIT